jgi:hypothetical protein
MRKSGLHKQISSIFDGVPIPHNSIVAEEPDTSSVPVQPQDTIEPQSPEPAAPVDQASSPSGASLVKRLTSNPSECASAPSIRIGRPMPLPKTVFQSVKKVEPAFSSQMKKAVFGSAKGSMDSRQKKMAALVGILSIVFGAVLLVTLGGLGKGSAIAAAAAGAETGSQTAAVQQKTVEEWKAPEPLPANIRNAAAPAVKQGGPDQTSGTNDSGGPVVRGILFSKQKPSAIINDQVLTVGQTIDGAKILQITRDTVEFEANGKRWTQSVQR